MAGKSKTIQAKVSLTPDIQNFISRIQSGFKNIKSLGIDKAVESDVDKAIELLNDLSKAITELGNGKVNISNFSKAEKQITDKIKALDSRTTALEKTFSILLDTMSKTDSSNFANELKEISENMQNLQTTTEMTVGVLHEFVNGAEISRQQLDGYEKLDSVLANIQKKLSQDSSAKLESGLKAAEEQLSKVYDRYVDSLAVAEELENVQDKSVESMQKMVKARSEVINNARDLNILIDQFGDKFLKNFSSTKIQSTPLDQIQNELEETLVESKAMVIKWRDDVQDEINKIEPVPEIEIANKKSGGKQINIPIDISTSQTTLIKRALAIVNAVNSKMADNPIELELDFTTAWGKRKNKELLKRFQSQIDDLSKDTDVTELQKLADSITASFGDQIKIHISADQDLDEIVAKLEEVRKKIHEKFSINPYVELTDESKEEVQGELDELSKYVTLKIANLELTEGALENTPFENVLNEFHEISGEIKNIFASLQEGLNNLSFATVDSKLSEIKELVFDVARFSFGNNQQLKRIDTKLYKSNETLSSIYAEGIKEGTSEVEQAATDMTQSAINAVKKAQDSNSPSKKTEKLGKDFADGEAKGILKNTQKAEKAGRELAEAAKKGFKEGSQYSSEAQELFDLLNAQNGNSKVSEEEHYAQLLKEELALQKEQLDNEKAIAEQSEKKFNNKKHAENYYGKYATAKQAYSDALAGGASQKTLTSLMRKLAGYEKAHPLIGNQSKKEFLESVGFGDETTKKVEETVKAEAKLTEQAKAAVEQVNRLDKGFEWIVNKTKEFGNFNLAKKTDKAGLSTIVDQFIKYQNQGGEKQLSDITNNKKALEKLTDEYIRQCTVQEENAKSKKKRHGDEKKVIEKTTEAIKEQTKAEEKLSQTQKGKGTDKVVDSAKGIGKESEALSEVKENAEKAATSKEEFASANEKVLSSIIDSLKGLENEGKAFEQLNKLINNLNSKGNAKLENTVKGLHEIVNALSAPLNGDTFIDALERIAQSGSKLSDIASILSASKKDLLAAQNVLDNIAQKDINDFIYNNQDRIEAAAKTAMSDMAGDGGSFVNISKMESTKDGLIEVIGLMRTADNEFKQYTVRLTKDLDVVGTNTETNTARIAKQVKIYAQVQQAFERMFGKSTSETDEVFVDAEADPDLWEKLISWARDYGYELGNIQKITRQTRQNGKGELLESFSVIGDKGHVTIGAEDEIVASSQTYEDISKLNARIKTLTKSAKEYYALAERNAMTGLNQAEADELAKIENEYSDITSEVQRLTAMLGDATSISKDFEDAQRQVILSFSQLQSEYTEKALTKLEDAKNNPLGKDIEYTEKFASNIQDAINKAEELRSIIKTKGDNVELWDEATIKRVAELHKGIDKVTISLKNNNNIIAKSGSVDKLLSKINKDLNDNTAMPKELRREYEALRAEIDATRASEEGLTSVDFRKVTNQFNHLHEQMLRINKTGKSMVQSIAEAAKSQTTQFIARYFSLQDWIRYGREVFENIKNIDSALTELRKVSDASTERLTQNFETSAKTAQELGATISQVINITSDWARLGYNVDEAEELAKVTTMFETVGDNMNAETASGFMISTLQGFQMAAEEAESVVDKYNEVANNFAIDTRGIGEALTRSAASFYAANTDLSKAIALVTAANEVVQNPEAVGTTFKTLSARIRGAKTELEDLGEEEDEFTKTTSKLRDLVKGLTGFDIMKDENTFKDIYEILLGIGEEWDKLTDVERASLGEALAGKRNANTLYAVLGNLDTLQEAYKAAEESAGSAAKEQQNYAKSIQYSVDRLKASIEEISHDLVDSQDVKNIVEFFNRIVQGADKVVEEWGLIAPIITAIGSAALFKNFGAIQKAFSGLAAIGKLDVLVKAGAGNKALGEAIKGMSAQTAIATMAQNGLNEAQIRGALAASGMAGAEIQGALAAQGAATSTNVFTAAVDGLAASLGITTSALLTIAGVLAIAGVAIYAGKKVWDNYNVTVKETQEEIDKVSDKIGTLNSEIQQLRDIDYRNTAQQERLRLLEEELAIQESILETKKRINLEEKVGQKFTDYYDEENYWTALYAARGESHGRGDLNEQLMSRIHFDELAEQYNELKGKPKKTAEEIEEFNYVLGELGANSDKAEEDLANISQGYLELKQAKEELEERGETDGELYKSVSEAYAEYESDYEGLKAVIKDTAKLLGTYDYSSEIKGILGKKEFDGVEETLVNLGKDGSLSIQTLTKSFIPLIEALEAAGIGAEDLYAYIMNLADPGRSERVSAVESIVSEMVGEGKSKELAEQRQKYYNALMDWVGGDDKKAKAVAEINTEFDTSEWDVEDVISQAQKKFDEAESVKIKTEPSDIATSVKNVAEKLKPQFDELGELYQSIFYGSKSGGFTLENVDTAQLEGLRKTFGELDKELNIDWGEQESAINQFLDTVTSAEVKSKSLAEQQRITQEAFNELATSYFYSADGLKDVNKETADALEQMFGQLGISNAHEVIEAYIHPKLETNFVDTAKSEIGEAMDELGKGGAVDLKLRPVIPAEILRGLGWEDALKGEVATVMTSTFSNEAGDIAINFTPIITDEDGNYVGALSPKELTEYAEGVIAGTREDDLKLQIGAKFEGKDAIEQAVRAAQKIHEMQDAYYNFSEILKDVNDENAKDIELQLEAAGVTNANALVTQTLADNKAIQAANTELAAGKSAEEVNALLTEAKASEVARIAAFQLAVQEQILGNTSLNFDEKIAELQNLANAYLTTANAARVAAYAEGLEKSVQYGGMPVEQAEKMLANYTSNLSSTLEFEPVNIEFAKEDGGKTTAGGAGKDAGDAYVEAFEKELQKLDDAYERGEMSLGQYLDAYKALIDKFFKDREEYAEEYAKRLHDYLSKMKDYYDGAISGVTKLLDRRINAVQKQKDAAIKAIEEERDAAIGALEERKKAIDKEIKAKQKQIKSIDKEIKAIQDANKARKDAIDLTKAQYELEKAQMQRSQFVLKAGQLVYQNDPESVRNAQQDLADKEDDAKIAKLEKQKEIIESQIELLEEEKEAIDEQIDALNEMYDKMLKDTEAMFDSLLDKLEKQKEKWEELAEIKEVAEAYAAIQEVFGELGYTVDDVLNDVPGAFDDFKNKYLTIMSDMSSGNQPFLDGLKYATGEATSAFGTISDNAGQMKDALGEVASATQPLQTAASNIKAVGDNAQTASSGVGNLKKSTDGISSNLDSINGKSFDTLISSVGSIEKALESLRKVLQGEGEGGLSKAFDDISAISFTELERQFGNLLSTVSILKSKIGTIGDDTGVGLLSALKEIEKVDISKISQPMSDLVTALNNLNTTSLGGYTEGEGATGIIGQFSALKKAVQSVTGALGGEGGEPENSGLSGNSKGGTGNEEATGTLISGIEAVKQSVVDNIGAGKESEEGTAIGSFNALGATITEDAKQIGTSKSEADEESLIGSILSLPQAVEDGMRGENGIIQAFEDLSSLIGECAARLQSLIGSLTNLKNSSLGGFGISGSLTSWQGNAHAQGTWGADKTGKTLVGELGAEMVVSGNKWRLVGEHGAEFANIKKNDIVFNHKQTEDLLKHGKINSHGKALANGTSITPLSHAANAEFDRIAKQLLLNSSDVRMDIGNIKRTAEDINNTVQNITTNNTNSSPVINVGDLNFTLTGVTSTEVMNQIGKEMERTFDGLALNAYQRAMKH